MKTYKYISIEEQKYKIFETTTNKFFEELMINKSITYQKLRELFYLVISTAETRMKRSGKYNEEYKNDFYDMINELRNLKEFSSYAKIIVASDAKDLEIGIKTIVNLSEFANRKRGSKHINSLKGDYTYRLELPFFKRENEKIIAIKYINTGYPYDIIEFNKELILTKTFFKECTNEELDEIIVYDFMTMKRYIVKDINPDFMHIFNILKIIDNKTVFANNGYNCYNCQHYSYCKDNTKYKNKSFEKIRKEFKDEKENQKLQQDS